MFAFTDQSEKPIQKVKNPPFRGGLTLFPLGCSLGGTTSACAIHLARAGQVGVGVNPTRNASANVAEGGEEVKLFCQPEDLHKRRPRLQAESDSLGGVQTRHYDRQSTMDEKRKALELWEGRLGVAG